jgi:hypothetical protein
MMIDPNASDRNTKMLAGRQVSSILPGAANSLSPSIQIVSRFKSIWDGRLGSLSKRALQDPDCSHGDAITASAIQPPNEDYHDDQGCLLVDPTKGRIIDGRRPGTARPLPRWRLPSGPDAPPIDRIFGSGIAPRPEQLVS